MVCFRYVIVNTLHKGDNKDDNNNNNNDINKDMTRIWEKRNAYRVLARKPDGKSPFTRHSRR